MVNSLLIFNLPIITWVYICFIIVLFIGFAIVLFVLRKKDFEISNSYKKHSIKRNVIEVNLLSKEVFIYNISNKSISRKMTLDNFLFLLHESERNNFLLWCEDLLNIEFDEKNSMNVKLFSSLMSLNKKTYHKNLLKAYSINKKEKIIYFESVFLLNLPCNFNKNKNKYSYFFQDYKDISSMYENGKFLRGCAISIKIENKDSNYIIYNKTEIEYYLLDSLYKNLSTNTIYFYIRDNNKFEINLLDSKAITRYSLKKMIKVINDSLLKTFEILNFNYYFNFYVVGGLVSELNHDCSLMNDQLEELFDKSTNESSNIALYKIKNNKDENTNELVNIVRNNLINFTFSHIIKISNSNLNPITNYGYLLNFKFKDSKYKSFNELLENLNSIDDIKNIYASGLRNALSIYINERESYFSKLVIEIKKDNLLNLLTTLEKIEDLEETHLMFMIDLRELLNNKEETLNLINELKKLGIELAGLIKTNDIYVDKELCSKLDAFFIYASLNKDVKGDSKEFMKIHSILDRIVGSKKPLIIYGSNSYVEMELFNKAGINYFSNDFIATPTSSINNLEKKVIKKITSIVRN